MIAITIRKIIAKFFKCSKLGFQSAVICSSFAVNGTNFLVISQFENQKLFPIFGEPAYCQPELVEGGL